MSATTISMMPMLTAMRSPYGRRGAPVLNESDAVPAWRCTAVSGDADGHARRAGRGGVAVRTGHSATTGAQPSPIPAASPVRSSPMACASSRETCICEMPS